MDDFFLEGGSCGHLVDSTGSIASEDSVVSLLAPILAPGVFNDPKWQLCMKDRNSVRACEKEENKKTILKMKCPPYGNLKKKLKKKFNNVGFWT